MSADVDKLWLNADHEGDWYALHRGCWAIPEGTRAEWVAALNAIENGGSVSFKRLAATRLPSGNAWIRSPRNMSSEHDSVEVAASDVPRFLAMVREGLAEIPNAESGE